MGTIIGCKHIKYLFNMTTIIPHLGTGPFKWVPELVEGNKANEIFVPELVEGY